jgi:hypothetical protein
MAQKMATVERVEELLEKLRAASWGHAVKGANYCHLHTVRRTCNACLLLHSLHHGCTLYLVSSCSL